MKSDTSEEDIRWMNIMLKIALYIVTLPISIWALESLHFEVLFKKGRVLQMKILYVMVSFALSYLVTNFLYDFAYFSQLR